MKHVKVILDVELGLHRSSFVELSTHACPVLYAARQGQHYCDHASFMFDPANNLSPILILQDASYTVMRHPLSKHAMVPCLLVIAATRLAVSRHLLQKIVGRERLQPLQQSCS